MPSLLKVSRALAKKLFLQTPIIDLFELREWEAGLYPGLGI